MNPIIRTIFFAILMAPICMNLSAQENEIDFNIDGTSPLITPGRLGDINTRFTNAGAVLFHEGEFHMFRPAFSTWATRANVDYMTSPDGLNWTSFQPEPIFSHDQVPFDAMAMPTSVIVDSDGTWKMYFFLVPRTGNLPAGIVAAAAPNPEGPWIMEERLLVDLGSSGEWDSLSLAAPRVLIINNEYVMYYGGQHDTSGDTLIGMAKSQDGLNWTKYNDPSTINAPFAESDPIFVPDPESAPWENSRIVQDPRIVSTPDGYVMLYSSYNGFRPNTNHAYGLAVSDDGIHWERTIDYPVFTGRDVGNQITWFQELTYANGTFYMYVSIVGAGGGTRIHGGTYSGRIIR